MMILGILWPTFALVALVFVVWFVLFLQRFAHMKRTPPAASDFESGEAAMRYFRPVEMPANNLANLFEMPVLYFALVPLLIVTSQAGYAQVILAWLFVAARALHSYIHIGPKKVQPRFIVYLLSVAILMAMWIGFFVDFLTAAHVYQETMDGMETVL